jgi:hypothetical protein
VLPCLHSAVAFQTIGHRIEHSRTDLADFNGVEALYGRLSVAARLAEADCPGLVTRAATEGPPLQLIIKRGVS